MINRPFFITKLRLDKAKDLLIRTDLTISDISAKCGFDNIPYFSYLFKKQIKLSSGEVALLMLCLYQTL